MCLILYPWFILLDNSLDVTVLSNPLSLVLRDLKNLDLPFLSSETSDEPAANNSPDVDQSRDDSTDGVEPIMGAGCAELYSEVERPSNPQLDESTNIASSTSSGLKDITRPGTPMPGRISRRSSSHDPEQRDITEILARALGPGDDRLSDTEMPDNTFSLSRTRFVKLSPFCFSTFYDVSELNISLLTFCHLLTRIK